MGAERAIAKLETLMASKTMDAETYEALSMAIDALKCNSTSHGYHDIDPIDNSVL